MRIILKDGSGAVILKHLAEDADRHGNVRLYFRRRGFKKVRLRQEIGTEAFLEEYRTALKATEDGRPAIVAKSHPKATVAWLVTEYKASGTFLALDLATQDIRRRHLDWFSETRGHKRYRLLRPLHLTAIIEKRSATPHGANNLLKSIRALFKWAVKAGHTETNPAREVEKLSAPSDGFHTWTVAEILQFMERHPANTKAGLCFALLYYLGVRRSDVVGLGPQMEQGNILRVIETKGRRRKIKITELTIVPELRSVLNLHPTEHLTYLTTERGAPFTRNGFGNKFKDWCIQAGLSHCSAHGVRKGGATIAADQGATEYELMSMYGWANPTQAAIYTRKANRKRLAGIAAGKLSLEDQKTNAGVPLDSDMVSKKCPTA